MRVLTHIQDGRFCLGLVKGEGNTVVSFSKLGLEYASMEEFIEDYSETMKEEIEKKLEGVTGIPYESIEKAGVIPHPKSDVICLGINYAEHAEESARYADEFSGERPYTIYFSKRVRNTVADGGIIEGHFDLTEKLDYEVELAVIIGKEAKNVSKEDAKDYIFGYTILNDISARDLQVNHKQWYFGKSLDNFTPIGPWIVTADEIAYPPTLNIRSKINGELRQNSNTNMLITSIDDVIFELTKGMTLDAGTIIAMGTPSGVGLGFVPPKFLKLGDVVECEIESIGVLSNMIGECCGQAYL